MAATGFCQTLPSIATWAGNRNAAVSLTFDDNHPIQLQNALPELNKRNLKATFFIVTGPAYFQNGWAPMDWTLASAMVDSGHELGGHSMTHISERSRCNEVKQSIDSLKKYFPSQKGWTYAPPAGNTLCQPEVTANCIASRGYSFGQIESSAPSDFYYVKTLGIMGTPSDIVKAIDQRGWAVEVIHCVSPANQPDSCTLGDNVVITALARHLDTLVARSHEIWVAPFGEVIRYIRERQAATINRVAGTTTELVYDLTDGLDDSIYTVPLTMKMPLPSGWTGCSVRQGTTAREVIITGDTAIFDAIPDKGRITISQSGSTSVRYGRPGQLNPAESTTNGRIKLSLPASGGTIRVFTPAGKLIQRIDARDIGHQTFVPRIGPRGSRLVFVTIERDGVSMVTFPVARP